MGTIPSVAVVTLTGEAQDGFLRVVYDGQEGWADAAYLEVADTSSGAVLCKTSTGGRGTGASRDCGAGSGPQSGLASRRGGDCDQ